MSYPLRSQPFGIAWEEWIKRWWKWCYGDDLTTCPALDGTGELSGRGQVNDKVWFLAGTFGGSCERRCTIPEEKSLFFPVLNDIVSFAADPQLQTEEQLYLYAKADLDNTMSLCVVIDGNEFSDIWKYRIRTSVFDLNVPALGTESKYVKTRAVSDGYWIFLPPFCRGKHTVYFSGEKLEFDKASSSTIEGTEDPLTFSVAVTYHLTVR